MLKKILLNLGILSIKNTEIISYDNIKIDKDVLSFKSNEINKEIKIPFNEVLNKGHYLKEGTTPLFYEEKLLFGKKNRCLKIVLPKKISEERLEEIWKKSQDEIKDLIDED